MCDSETSDARWEGSHPEEGRPAKEATTPSQQRTSVLSRLVSGLTPTKRAVATRFEICEEMKEWLGEAIPPYPPDYFDPAAI